MKPATILRDDVKVARDLSTLSAIEEKDRKEVVIWLTSHLCDLEGTDKSVLFDLVNNSYRFGNGSYLTADHQTHLVEALADKSALKNFLYGILNTNEHPSSSYRRDILLLCRLEKSIQARLCPQDSNSDFDSNETQPIAAERFSTAEGAAINIEEEELLMHPQPQRKKDRSNSRAYQRTEASTPGKQRRDGAHIPRNDFSNIAIACTREKGHVVIPSYMSSTVSSTKKVRRKYLVRDA